MKRYIKNLIAALCGRNPFREELDEKNVQLDKAAANVQSLQDMYYSAVDRWNHAEKRSASLQQLVENLRERIKEKDSELESVGRDFHERMEQMKQGYQKRIEEYNAKIDELSKK
jgi:chromosome segregation ATPase